MKMKFDLDLQGLRSISVICFFILLLISCVNQETVTDVDGNEYKTVQIGNQLWMAENLRATRYQNGDPIPDISALSRCSDLLSGAYSYYENDPNHVDAYGLMYNWFAVDDNRNICPEGWHVPNNEEWIVLEMALGMSEAEARKTSLRGTDEGGKLKEKGTTHWEEPNTGATNESGFTALPGGGRPCYGSYDGQYYYLGTKASIWTSDAENEEEAWMRNLDFDNSMIKSRAMPKQNGLSVRCIQD
jgi:uncharacterized protein (TIGR02145 family)